MEEPAGAEILVGQGDVIKGKISREEVADLIIPALNSEAHRLKPSRLRATCLSVSQPTIPNYSRLFEGLQVDGSSNKQEAAAPQLSNSGA
jgi:hypothetical protein